MTENPKPEFLCLVGPTGSGKSGLALEIAARLATKGIRAEIVNADAMQFYQGMDIGTAKLPLADRRGITHHLIDWLSVTQESTAANYQVVAREKISALVSDGVFPIVVGGSMLYVAALVNTFDFPGRDEELRAKLEQELVVLGPEAMHAKLALLDEVAASRIEPMNGRRIVRALEIVMITGEPFVAALPEQWESFLPVLEIGLNSDRAHLVDRLAKRVEKMWEDGLVAEVSGLIDQGLRESKTARQAIGYSQALEQIDGLIEQEEAIAQTTQLTQRYARRQMSWFRRDPRINWFDYQNENLVEEVMELIYSNLLTSGK
ncbi:MAG: tRNA (adenosine(37)-N6)-dimethylallyltransferase MiaA [Rhodoluna sp.]|nr:tRNA (adenosine(37)-N6)-dimethylallyltransferase MiaA [Rhodoluna sp.]